MFVDKKLLVSVLVLLFIAPVFADHTASVTISPDVANCDELGNTFTITVENSDTSADSILQVEIYKSLTGISDFECGPAPEGWSYLPWPDEDRCIYVTGLQSSDKIDPSEDLNFTFNATMSFDSCYCQSMFKVVTVDDNSAEGDRDTNNVYVDIDCTNPEIEKEITEGTYQGVCPPEKQDSGDICWMTHGTIHVTAYDNDTCDLGIDYCEWSYTVDGVPEDSGIKQNGTVLEWDIVFDEDSVHVLNITCVDYAGNKIEDIETFKVDSTPPETNKTISEPKKVENGVEWIDTVTEITFTFNDPDPTGYDCNIGVDKTWYKNTLACEEAPCWDPVNSCTAEGVDSPYDEEKYEGCIDDCQESCSEHEPDTDAWFDCVEDCAYDTCNINENWKLYRGEPINKGQESCHMLYYFSVDHLGNKEEMNVNCFFVDKTPPEVEKIISAPKVEVYDDDSLMAECLWPSHCNGASLDLGELLAPGNVKMGYRPGKEEGCMGTITFYYSQDGISWTQFHSESFTSHDINPGSGEYWEMYYTTQTVPEPFRYIKMVVNECSLDESNVKNHITYVTHATDITFTCTDQEPHPSGDEELCFKVSYDLDPDGYNTDEYCTKYDGTMEDGWCCVPATPNASFVFNFNENEDSYHDLEYFCRDAVKKSSEPQIQYYKVDSQPPIINKTVIGPQVGDCPPESEGDECWIRDWTCESGGTTIHIEAYDNNTYENCTVGEVTCDWYYYLDGNYESGETDLTPPFDIKFWQDTVHELHINCTDALGNWYEDVETFYVDSSAPETVKTYGQPQKVEPNCLAECNSTCGDDEDCIEQCVHASCTIWINSNTPITLSATDKL